MRILFDQGTPVPLRHALAPHVVETAFDNGWSNLSNGNLLDAAEDDSFDLFITTDQNLRYQQNLSGRKVSILPTTRWPVIEKHVTDVVAAVNSIKPNQYRELRW